jgi:hypothetical protein
MSSAQPTGGPYRDESTNVIYQLLFCDRVDLYKDHHNGSVDEPWSTLFSQHADPMALAKIAEDEQQESRVRVLAFNALRSAGHSVPPKKHLGTIIEVRLPEGLDTMAVFSDGGARYINHSGKVIVIEGKPNPFNDEISAVIEASQPIVAAIGPWEKERLPPPAEGNIRLTFLVSDGLYFGEGPMEVMQQQPIAAPLISAATRLLVKLVAQS